MQKRLFGLRVFALCGVIVATMVLYPPAGSAQPTELRPNLQPFPAFTLALTPDLATGGTQLRFSTRSWNKGAGPLELVAGETGPEGQHVYQRVYSSDGSHQDYFVGRFEWHPLHNHFHFQDYALYYLEPIDAPGGSVKSGTKTTFCVMDTNKVDGSLPGAPLTPVYATCGAQVQGMSVGWADTYGSNLAGQSVDFTGNPSGDYCLTIMIDPKGRLLESNEGDNVASTLLRVDAERSTVTVLNSTGCTPTGGDVVVRGLEPTLGTTGSTVDLRITGSGFAPGMAVTFGGGSGPPPTVSNVRVVDGGTTIEARVTIRRGKIGKDPVWDLRVGSAVKFNAFTVER